jgi:hypothetical protein
MPITGRPPAPASAIGPARYGDGSSRRRGFRPARRWRRAAVASDILTVGG